MENQDPATINESVDGLDDVQLRPVHRLHVTAESLHFTGVCFLILSGVCALLLLAIVYVLVRKGGKSGSWNEIESDVSYYLYLSVCASLTFLALYYVNWLSFTLFRRSV